MALAEDGHDVAIHYSNSETDSKDTADTISALGGMAVTLRADLSDSVQCLNLIERASNELGRPLTVLINNASAFQNMAFEDVDFESWDHHFAINCRAPFFLIQKFAKQVPDTTIDPNGEPMAQGVVINLGDHWGAKLAPEFASYAISKSGIV